MEQKVKIYQGVVCLEIASAGGGRWWYQGGGLAYTPFLASQVRHIQVGVVAGSGRQVVAVKIKKGRVSQLVAVNLVRSDVPALVALGVWPSGVAVPFAAPVYSPWPHPADFELLPD